MHLGLAGCVALCILSFFHSCLLFLLISFPLPSFFWVWLCSAVGIHGGCAAAVVQQPRRDGGRLSHSGQSHGVPPASVRAGVRGLCHHRLYRRLHRLEFVKKKKEKKTAECPNEQSQSDGTHRSIITLTSFFFLSFFFLSFFFLSFFFLSFLIWVVRSGAGKHGADCARTADAAHACGRADGVVCD